MSFIAVVIIVLAWMAVVAIVAQVCGLNSRIGEPPLADSPAACPHDWVKVPVADYMECAWCGRVTSTRNMHTGVREAPYAHTPPTPPHPPT